MFTITIVKGQMYFLISSKSHVFSGLYSGWLMKKWVPLTTIKIVRGTTPHRSNLCFSEKHRGIGFCITVRWYLHYLHTPRKGYLMCALNKHRILPLPPNKSRKVYSTLSVPEAGYIFEWSLPQSCQFVLNLICGFSQQPDYCTKLILLSVFKSVFWYNCLLLMSVRKELHGIV